MNNLVANLFTVSVFMVLFVRCVLPAQERQTVPQPKPTPEGQRFVASDVDRAHPIYATMFDSPSVLDDWQLEGGLKMSVVEGKLVLESERAKDPSKKSKNHLVCWLKKEVPANFLLEFSVRPEDRSRGLNIVFFNARGIGGETVFDTSLKPRDGTFRQYHSSDLNNYHTSYWASTRGTANLRKNNGFNLIATGKDLIGPAPAEAFQTVRIYKRGGTIRVTVDDNLEIAFDDDGKTFGPVHAHSGWIGLRQMGHTERCEYDHLRIYPLAAH